MSAIDDLRRETAEAIVRCYTGVEADLRAIAHAFGGRVEEALQLGYADGFEACRASTMATIAVSCVEAGLTTMQVHQLVMAVHNIKKEPLK